MKQTKFETIKQINSLIGSRELILFSPNALGFERNVVRVKKGWVLVDGEGEQKWVLMLTLSALADIFMNLVCEFYKTA